MTVYRLTFAGSAFSGSIRLTETNGIPKARTFEQSMQRSLIDHLPG
jgi:hypothetical protein